jgi:hypothetical protein
MNAKRRSAPKGRGGSSGGANPKNDGRITEEQHDEAMRVLRAEYYQSVRGIAATLAERVKDGEITDRDGFEQAIHESVDGSYWVIYTHANFQVLLCSDNHDAYSEEYGEPPVQGDSINWAALAFAAMERDVRQQIDAEGIEPDWDNLEEARPRRGARHPLANAHAGATYSDVIQAIQDGVDASDVEALINDPHAYLTDKQMVDLRAELRRRDRNARRRAPARRPR